MVYGAHRLKTPAARFKWLRLSLSAFMLLATALEGMRLCLCPQTASTFGQQCHAEDACCGSPASGDASVLEGAAHDCGHLTFDKLPPVDRVSSGSDLLTGVRVSPAALSAFRPHHAARPLVAVGRPDKHPPGAWPPYGLVVVRTEQILC
jgi:hypothetical protein